MSLEERVLHPPRFQRGVRRPSAEHYRNSLAQQEYFRDRVPAEDDEGQEASCPSLKRVFDEYESV